MERRNETVIKLAQTALMAALCYVAFAYLKINIPMPGGDATALHIGNAFCVLGALIMGGLYGGAGGAIGMTIGDLFDPVYVVYAPKTFLLKLCIGLITGLIAHRMGHITHTSDKKKILLWTILASAGGLVFNMVADPLVGYFYKLLILGKPAADITLAWNIASTSINAVLSAIVSVAVYMALRPALQKTGLFWKIGKDEGRN